MWWLCMAGPVQIIVCRPKKVNINNITSSTVSQLLGDLKPYIIIVLDLVVDVVVVFVTQY